MSRLWFHLVLVCLTNIILHSVDGQGYLFGGYSPYAGSFHPREGKPANDIDKIPIYPYPRSFIFPDVSGYMRPPPPPPGLPLWQLSRRQEEPPRKKRKRLRFPPNMPQGTRGLKPE